MRTQTTGESCHHSRSIPRAPRKERDELLPSAIPYDRNRAAINTFPSKSACPNSLFSISSPLFQKSAHLIQNKHYQVPLVSNSCALFSWKSLIIKLFPKTYRVYTPSPFLNHLPHSKLDSRKSRDARPLNS